MHRVASYLLATLLVLLTGINSFAANAHCFCIGDAACENACNTAAPTPPADACCTPAPACSHCAPVATHSATCLNAPMHCMQFSALFWTTPRHDPALAPTPLLATTTIASLLITLPTSVTTRIPSNQHIPPLVWRSPTQSPRAPPASC